MSKNFLAAIVEINSVGMWSIFGLTFNGFGLAFIWIIEALIIIVGPFAAVYKTKNLPLLRKK